MRGAAPRENFMHGSFSRQTLHARRLTAPRWKALLETCTKQRSRVSVLQHEGCESALACATLSPPRGRRALLRQLKAGHQHRVLRLHGTPALGNTHGSALLMRWAWPMSTAATARPGAPFVQKGEPFRGALPVEKSARVPAPKGAITCSPRSGRKISARRLESQS